MRTQWHDDSKSQNFWKASIKLRGSANAAYNEVGGPIVCGVLGACLREFIDAGQRNALDKESIGIVEKMDQLFRVDRMARETDLTPKTRQGTSTRE
jgi:hypothetical protein